MGTLALLLVLFTSGTAMAGGWAVTTLDSVPAPEAGETVDVGFTIRQHGVSPVTPDGDVAIVIQSPEGAQRTFTAEPDGAAGHFVAEVTFPDDGTWTWLVRQGIFAEQGLGSIEVAPTGGGTSPAATVADYRWPSALRFGLPLLALLLAGWAVSDLVVGRRRPVAAV